MTYGPITLAGSARSGWSFGSLTGWWGQSADKSEVRERPITHGAFPTLRSVRSARVISFTANFLSTSQAEIEDAMDELASIGAEAPVRVSIATPSGDTWRTVKVEACEPLNYRAGLGFARLAVDLTAEDPRRYATGEWQSTTPPSPGTGPSWPLKWPVTWAGGGSTGRITLANEGRAPSSPQFRLFGESAATTITCVDDGSRVGLGRGIPAGSYVDIDYAARKATLEGGFDVSRWLLYREWSEVARESARTYQFDADAANGARMEGKVDSAWW
ncbi:hypothetical protein SK224_08370 [Microbacterium sp. BG28]|nr:hypothetical protein [Microbacterium sp. BG28]